MCIILLQIHVDYRLVTIFIIIHAEGGGRWQNYFQHDLVLKKI